MGTDIHAYIEYTYDERPQFVYCWGEDIDVGRNYSLFGVLAGVRRSKLCVFPPRGIPEIVSSKVRLKFYALINDKLFADPTPQRRGVVSEKIAADYVKNHGFKIEVIYGDRMIQHPDWHSPSWLTVPELEKVQAVFREIEMEPDFDDDGFQLYRKLGPHQMLDAVIGAMKAIDGDWVGRSRFVFWFDN